MTPDSDDEPHDKSRQLREGAANVYRRAILDAAEKVFGRQGFAEAKISDVAKETGLAVGTLYNYFSSKESIFHALLEDRGEMLAAEIDQIARTQGGAIERLRNLVKAKCIFLERHVDMLEIFAQIGIRSELGLAKFKGPGYQERHARVLAGFESVVRDAIKDGTLAADLNPRELTAGLNGMINGMVNSWLAGNRSTKLSSSVTSAVMVLFLEGARKR